MIQRGLSRFFISALATGTTIALLAGCADSAKRINENPQQYGAPTFGAAIGVTAGNSGAAAAGGGAAGAVVGLAAAPYLAKRDTVYFDKAIDQAAVAPRGQTVVWENPHTGTTGRMTRLNDVEVRVAAVCRNLRSEITKRGRTSTEILLVCRDDLTPWYIEWDD